MLLAQKRCRVAPDSFFAPVRTAKEFVMPYPSLTVDLEKLTANTALVVRMCREAGISVMGVTKAFCGDPEIASAMQAGGPAWLGDSRIQNLARLRAGGITLPLCLLRLPMLSEVEDVVRVADMSQVSELATAKALSRAAFALGRRHRITLMADLGDLREGLLPQNILQAAKAMATLPALELYGLGVNLACYGGVIPTPEKLQELVDLAKAIRRETGLPLPLVSGGNSSSLHLLPHAIPKGITQLRIGEGILLGRETTERRLLPGAYPDIFTLHTELIELQEKPSVPLGEIGQDAFGNAPVFEDRGMRMRAIFAIGRQDVIVDGLEPRDPEVEIIGSSSDHMIADVTDARRPLAVGSVLQCNMRYGALISAMLSPYVTKVCLCPAAQGCPCRTAGGLNTHGHRRTACRIHNSTRKEHGDL